MKTLTDPQLLGDYTGHGSEEAFAELVRRHIDFVYSAALRMVRDSQLAGDVTQGVFLALAQNARQLADRPRLAGWLHRTTQNLAANAVRSDVRRRAREQEAAVMTELLATPPDASWEDIAPQLDAALLELDEPDRDALLLRYFEHQSAKEMAQTLGISDEAAQKRVNRAVERLRELFAKRGVTVGAAGLVVLLSANAVHSAPAGLAVTITMAATLTGTATTTTTVIAATKTIAMTTLSKVLITIALAAAVGVGLFQAHQNSRLRDQVNTLQKEQAPLAEQVRQLQLAHDDATNRLALMADALAKAQKNPGEVLKLRGEVGQLRQEKAIAGEKSALSKLTADPATRKFVRDEQKAGMGAIYADFAKRLNLSSDQADKFNDLLADNVMDNIDLVTQALHDGKTSDQLNQMFSAADAALQDKIQALVGPDGLAQYQDYSRNLDSSLTAQQFKSMLTGDDAAVAAKTEQLTQLMQQQTQAALASAGLPANYQAVPILNFENIASAEQADQSLNLLDTIYAGVASQAASFLTPDELAKFQTFRTNAINNSRTVLAANRQMMAPLSQ